MNPLTQAVGWALLHLLWQATAIALVLAVVLSRMARRSPNARYVVGCVALALVLAAFLVTAVRAYDPVVSPTVSAPRVSVPVAPASSQVPAGRTHALLAAWSTGTERALPWIVGLWLGGVLLLSSRLVVSWWRTRRLVHGGVPPTLPEWEHLTARLCDALGIRHAVRLLQCAAVEVPAVVGSLRPVILLPVSALSGLTTEQIEMVLAHELAHVRRHDFLLNLLQTLVETLLFFHPAVWWMSRRVRVEREHCCDDLAIAVCGDSARYARALTRLEELRGEPLPLAVSAHGGSLLERVRRLAAQGGDVRPSASQWLATLGVLTLLLVAAAVPTIPARAKGEAAPPPEPAEAAEPVEPSEEGVPVEVNLPVEVQVPIAVPVTIVAGSAAVEAQEPVEVEEEAEPAKATKPGRSSGEVWPTVDELIALRAGGVTPEYLASMRALFPRVSLQDASSLAAMGVTPEYVKEMRGLGFPVLTPGTVTGLRAVGVTSEYVRQMRDAGLHITRADEATSLAAVGVTPEYVEAMRKLGFPLDRGSEVSGLRAVGVTAEFVKEMRDLGFAVDTAEEATTLLATGVTADWVKQMRAAGISFQSGQDAASLHAVGVTPEFVRRLAAAGYRDLSLSQLQRLAAFGVDDAFFRDLERYRTEKGDAQ